MVFLLTKSMNQKVLTYTHISKLSLTTRLVSTLAPHVGQCLEKKEQRSCHELQVTARCVHSLNNTQKTGQLTTVNMHQKIS